jgi:hypothetical protein
VDGKPLTHAETIVMEHGAIRLVSILKENLTGIRRTTPDGVEYFEPLPEGQVLPPEKIALALGEERHVYDIRAGKYLGRTAQVTSELSSSEAKIFALLPYDVKQLALKTADTFAAGKVLRFEAAIDAGGAQAGDHVFNVRVYRSSKRRIANSGEEIAYYARNIDAPKGAVTFILPVEQNPPSEFRVVVTDVLSGVSAEHDFSK